MGVYLSICFVTNTLNNEHVKFFHIVWTHIQYVGLLDQLRGKTELDVQFVQIALECVKH